MAGRVLRRPAAHWTSPGGERVLVVAPHPDDEVAGCGGTILLHRERGDEVVVCFATDGRRSRSLGLSPDEMAERRRLEALAAARTLGLTYVDWLGLPEGDWCAPDFHRSVRKLMDTYRPSLIYAPSLVDYHRDHLSVAVELASVLQASPDRSGIRMRAYQVQVPLTPILTNLLAVTGRVSGSTRQAAADYVSQRGSLERCMRMKRYAAAFHGVEGGEAEEFWELSVDSYCRVHPVTLVETARAFQGVWHLPVRDPVSYLTDLDRRRLLRQLARA